MVRSRAFERARRDRGISRGAALCRASGQPEISLPLFDRGPSEVLDSPAYRAALTNPTDWSKQIMARFKNMIRAVARITISRGKGRGAALGIVRLRAATGTGDEFRAAIAREARSGTPRRHHFDASDRERSEAFQTAYRRSAGVRSRRRRLVRADRCQNVNAVSATIAARFTEPDFERAHWSSTGIYDLMWDLAKSDIRAS